VFKVLIAEDDVMIADSVEEILAAHGYDVCGIALSVEEAVALGRQHMPDLAVIDLWLADGGLGTQIAAQLAGQRKLGIIYATANVSGIVLSAADGHASIAKPYSAAALVRGLEIVAEMVATGRASLPFPLGFKVLPPPATGRGVPAHE
jgi:DNA-binding response OmpR family regulator